MNWKKCLLGSTRNSTSSLCTFLTRRFLCRARRSGLCLNTRFTFIRSVKQWRIHELLLSHQRLICVLNICLLLVFEALHSLWHSRIAKSRLLAVWCVCKAMKVLTLEQVWPICSWLPLTAVLKCGVQPWLRDTSSVCMSLYWAFSSVAWQVCSDAFTSE